MTNNQEILFRGFNPCEDGDTTIYVEGEAVKGEWVEGLLLKSLDENGTHFEIQTWHEDSDGVTSRLLDVLPSTVCPYTGKDDKNGVKIFKGDIIQANFKTPFVVEWDNDGCRYLGVQPNDNSRHFTASDKYICYLNDAQEVIGTIFDKPKEATP